MVRLMLVLMLSLVFVGHVQAEAEFRILEPKPDGPADNRLRIRVSIQSNHYDSVVATVEGLSIAVPYPNVAILDIRTLSYGPHILTVTANIDGVARTVSQRFFRDHLPTLTITSPTQNSYASQGKVRVTVTCNDIEAPCVKLKVRVHHGGLAAGYTRCDYNLLVVRGDSIDQTFDLSSYFTDRVALCFHGIDSRGQEVIKVRTVRNG